MKRWLLYPLLGFISLVFLMLLTLVGILFFKPTLIINPENLDWALTKSKILKSYSWKEADIRHEWLAWNQRRVSGHFKDFCLEFDGTAAYLHSCIKNLSWDFEVSYKRGEGVKSFTHKPFSILTGFTKVVVKETTTPPKEEAPPDIYGHWNMLWRPVVPDFDFKLLQNEIVTKEQTLKFDVSVFKKPEDLLVESMGFRLEANPKGLTLLAPHRYKVPSENKALPEMFLIDVKLRAQVEKKGIPLELTGALENIPFKVTSKIELPIKEAFSSVAFKKKTILATRAEIHVPEVQKSIGKFAPKPFNVLPAPLNSMGGSIMVNVTTKEAEKEDAVLVNARSTIDLKSQEQVFLMDLGTDVLLNLVTFKPEDIGLLVDFKQVNLKLPRISKKSLPPQFLPDSRIKTLQQIEKEKVQKKEPSTATTFHLEAANEHSLQMLTDLLDEPLRLNFNLEIDNGELKKGFVKILPLKTKVFKRPIQVLSMQVNFHYPMKPVIEGEVLFPLPEYKITMHLEGPVSEPRFAFSSKPPLSRDDIYSVLLFGRPLNDLDADDKRAAGQTNQILAQGILSLSVLYFLAGSPVEYIGYDPNTKTATAQFRLGDKSSLRVGRDTQGMNSTGVRRSIGKGWYIDTSATQYQKTDTSSAGNDYGVLLERVIAY